mgnify:FL=1|jgi:hypothetical protein
MADPIRKLTDREAAEFARILLSGAPVPEAVQYFWDGPIEEAVHQACVETWPTQPVVLKTIRQLTGGEVWHQQTDQSRLDVSLTKHYNELAYFLWTTNYAECDGATKLKADTCRQAIEAKVAGMAGRESPLAQFYHDLLTRYDAETAKVQ